VHVGDLEAHPEGLLDRAIRGELGAGERAALDRHTIDCSMCAAELEGARIFRAVTAPGKQDEAFFRTAINGAMARLQTPETLGQRLRWWMGGQRIAHRSAGLAALGAVATVAVGFFLLHSRQAVVPASGSRSLVLDDGSEVTPTAATAAIEVAEQTPTRTTVRLRSGSAQFRIRHDSRRLFFVDAGTVEIEDLGTVFRVTHEAAGRVLVAVSEGRVAVRYPSTTVRIEIDAGESRTFDPQPVSGTVPELPEALRQVASPASPAGVSRVGTARARSVEEPAALLLAADLARREHRPQAAVAPLRRLVDKYPKDPRAPSAAFTLGWVLLTDLGRPRDAAAAFAEAERHAPSGVLAEDAAARVAEAWQRAGDASRAAQAARHYEQLYPTGRHLPLMHALVGEP
jgi:transmembrane sensor